MDIKEIEVKTLIIPEEFNWYDVGGDYPTTSEAEVYNQLLVLIEFLARELGYDVERVSHLSEDIGKVKMKSKWIKTDEENQQTNN